MSIIVNDGTILTDSGDIATDTDCCCGDPECPTDCTGCPTEYKFTVETDVPDATGCGPGGVTCGDIDGTQACFDRAVGSTCTFTNGSCTGNSGASFLRCEDVGGVDKWVVAIVGNSQGTCAMIFEAPASGCPPTVISAWTLRAGLTCTGILTDITTS